MTGKELSRVGEYAHYTLSERQAYAQALAASGELLPKNYWTKAKPNPEGGIIQPRPNPGAVLYMTETADMLGIHPMAGLVNIHIIEGKPTLSAQLMAALVREAGHKLRVWVEGDTAIAELIRSDDPDFTFRVEWGDKEMNAAGLASKENWKKYRRSMKKARAITEVIREGASEVTMGAAYTPEEINPDLRVNEEGEPIELHLVDDGPFPRPTQDEATAAPIVDDTAKEVDLDWWAEAISSVGNREEALSLYRKAKDDALLATPFTLGDMDGTLGEVIIEVGKALAAAEAEGEIVEGEVEDEGEPAVLADDEITEDPDVIVEEE